MIKEGHEIISFVHAFLLKTWKQFDVIFIYEDDINTFGTPEEPPKAIDWLNKEFEMKDPGNTKFCLGNWILEE